MFDFHTHRLDTPPGAGIVCLPQEVLLSPDEWLDAEGHLPHADDGALYAVGIHPWWTNQTDFDLQRHLDSLRRLLPLPEVTQLGECGLDLLRGADASSPDIAFQREVFAAQVEFSETYHTPLTIHCVRAYDQLLSLHKQLRPSQTWTIHGFRGRPALARQLLAAGFNLSFGPRHNEESYLLTPSNRRHDETDAESQRDRIS